MRVLLTGGTGFVGSWLTRRLLAEGYEVHLLVREVHRSWRLEGVERDVRLHAADLEDRDSVRAAVARARPQWAFHLAVYGAFATETDLWRMVRTNVEGTIALAEACRDSGCEVLVNTGSSSEYGFQDRPMVEGELPEPNSSYAATKAAATLFCRFAAGHWGMRIPTLRLYSVYGPFEEPTRLIPRLLCAALEGKLPPLVAADVARDFVFVEDACEAFLAAASTLTPEAGAIFNVGSGVQTTLRELVALTRQLFDVAEEPRWGALENRQWDTTTWVADPQRAKRELRWQPRTPLGDGLVRTANWILERQDRLAFYRARRDNRS